jgi:hypothetical protein
VIETEYICTVPSCWVVHWLVGEGRPGNQALPRLRDTCGLEFAKIGRILAYLKTVDQEDVVEGAETGHQQATAILQLPGHRHRVQFAFCRRLWKSAGLASHALAKIDCYLWAVGVPILV